MITLIDLLDLVADIDCYMEIKNTDTGHRITLRKILDDGRLVANDVIFPKHYNDMAKQGAIEELFFKFNEHIQQYIK